MRLEERELVIQLRRWLEQAITKLQNGKAQDQSRNSETLQPRYGGIVR